MEDKPLTDEQRAHLKEAEEWDQANWSLTLDEPGGAKEVKSLQWRGPKLNSKAEQQIKHGKALAQNLIESGAVGDGPFHVAIVGCAWDGERPEGKPADHLNINVIDAS
jgi:hypothetical protein